MDINEDEYPYLMTEHTWSWGPVATVFEQKSPPNELVSNIAIAPFDDSGWLIVRQKVGWGIVGERWSQAKPSKGSVLDIENRNSSSPALIPMPPWAKKV